MSAEGTLYPWSTRLMACHAKRLELLRGGSLVCWLPSGIGGTVKCAALFEGELLCLLPDRQHCSCGVIGRLLGRGVPWRMELVLVPSP